MCFWLEWRIKNQVSLLSSLLSNTLSLLKHWACVIQDILKCEEDKGEQANGKLREC